MKRLVKFLGKERVLYMDEAGMLASDVYRWDWSEKGKRKYGQRAGIRQRRVNFIAETDLAPVVVFFLRLVGVVAFAIAVALQFAQDGAFVAIQLGGNSGGAMALLEQAIMRPRSVGVI